MIDAWEWERDLRYWGVKEEPLEKLKKKPEHIRMAYHEVLRPETFPKYVREIQKRVNILDAERLEEIVVFQLARILDNLVNKSENYEFEDEGSVHRYLIGMINNQSSKLIGNLVKEARRRARLLADLSVRTDEQEEYWQIESQQVFALSPRYRSVLLPRLLGYTMAEIAEIRGIPENTVKSRLRRARGLLAHQFEQMKVGGTQ